MPLYNQTTYLHQALQSLVSQSYGDFQLHILDDSIEDEPGEIAKRYAAIDSRIKYVRNPSRKGLIDNWKACFENAGAADYFAWVSDHDVWHRRWLEAMVGEIARGKNTVLVFPKKAYISANGKKISKKPIPIVSTEGLSDTDRIMSICMRGRGYGKMVYGLFSTSAVRQAGIFRRVLFPDVVLIFELSLIGDIKQVDEELFYQRRMVEVSPERQKNNLFPKKPWYTHLPWVFVNTAVIFWNTMFPAYETTLRKRMLGLLVATIYFFRYIGKAGKRGQLGSFYEWSHGKRPWMRRVRRRFLDFRGPFNN
jgi:glycosyltransferase involved in cell wall biosynthesis